MMEEAQHEVWTNNSKSTSDGRHAVYPGAENPVATVVRMVADGMTNPEILAAYPDLVEEDIAEALRFAAVAVSERELPLVMAS
jgi:uncharacterized protein (DUF433 family)